ncbi:hypothetical protein [Pseudidiomarina sediminum]|uniref:hypothetical protein n=1 Tax=Pseudidiomarina sediminum TaxID=431675 RepID=UPI001C952A61|nr:hypothetical protein [Pseudidiomarina sediminum]MBY6064505.1 hypothetical protein [Pseudidiomarina sediminum]
MRTFSTKRPLGWFFTVICSVFLLAACNSTAPPSELPPKYNVKPSEPARVSLPMQLVTATAAAQRCFADTPHYDRVTRPEPNTLALGTPDADGLILPLSFAEKQWWLDDIPVHLTDLLESAWPVQPKRLRLELNSTGSAYQLQRLRQRISHKWPQLTIEWSVADANAIIPLKQTFTDDRVGYHGVIDALPYGHRIADFYSVPLRTPMNESFAANQIERRVTDAANFLQWLTSNPTSAFAATSGETLRGQMCAAFTPKQTDRGPSLLDGAPAPVRIHLNEHN